MICKNCDNDLRTDFSYCPTCGAKVIRHRLTFKNVWEDISFQIFNLDNTLFKTIKHLFTRPDEVINSYISGTRKRYMNPISFFAIGVTLSGILFYVLRNVYHIHLTQNSLNNQKTPDLDFVFDYQGLMSYLIIPIYAMFTWLLFLDKKKLNYTEHLVANAFIFGQVSFVQVSSGLLIFGFFDVRYDLFNYTFLLIVVLYQFYVFRKVHHTGPVSTLLRALAYMVMLIILMIGIGILIFLIGYLTGNINIEDFKPPN
ncbi:MAG: DUF3667 domain-containing protein [Bacteroidota bacterium]|nr:DUF3667 domain-containing protein [Bacteroidota bacterium]